MQSNINFVGISNAPSDFSSEDGVMSTLVNLVPENGELKPIMPPKTLFSTINTSAILLAVHTITGTTGSNEKHYVMRANGSGDNAGKVVLMYYIEGNANPIEIGTLDIQDTAPKIAVVGNTLVVYSQDEMHYYIWKEVETTTTDDDGKKTTTYEFKYVDLGSHLPELKMEFGLIRTSMTAHTETKRKGGGYEDVMYIVQLPSDWSKSEVEAITNIESIKFEKKYHLEGDDDNWKSDVGNQTYIENQTCGIINTIHATEQKYGRFLFPFLVRYAYRMYDGSSITMHSAPILMLPTTSEAVAIFCLLPKEGTLEAVISSICFQSAYLGCRIVNSTINENWKDVIKSIDVFVSAPIYSFKAAGMDTKLYNFKKLTAASKSFGIFSDGSYHIQRVYTANPNPYDSPLYRIDTPRYTKAEMFEDLANKNLFYLLKSIPYESDSEWMKYAKHGATLPFHKIEVTNNYLSSLTNKEVMTDDYDSHDVTTATGTYVYNNRINLYDITKRLFGGFSIYNQSSDIGTSTTDPATYGFSVFYEIKESTGTRIVAPTDNISGCNSLPPYLFYPNINCTKAIVKYTQYGKTYYRTFKMVAHDFLNGAIAITSFWGYDQMTFESTSDIDSLSGYSGLLDTPTTDTYDECTKAATIWEAQADTSITEDPETSTKSIVLQNKIYTSEINMPFYFPVANINTIGTGKIIGVASTTKALSQGQFGQFPLYAFTDSGIWALTLTSTGGIATVTPTTRDVALDNGHSIAQLDDAIAFITDRGLMLLQGSDTMCLTEALKGDWFDPATLYGWNQVSTKSGIIDASLGSGERFFSNAYILYDYPRQRLILVHSGENISLMYSLTSKMWGMVDLGNKLVAVANTYPDCAVQMINRGGLSRYSSIVDISQTTESTMPVLAVSRPITMGDPYTRKTIYDVVGRGDNVAMLLYGTRDYKRWFYIGSSVSRHLHNLGGTPFNAFRLVMVGNLTSEQRLVGASIEYRPKDINTLR